ncbi:3-isopropylmalate dehydratase [Variovorax sp. VNK109]|uniref:LeuD/DmdB family oxidoreductase small subunit n=1 Tax=Variovorax sp. VNK109 TaxID=3400919 RepID=UPI003C0056B5
MKRLHRVWALGADIDTDVLAPGAYMKLGVEGIAPHCLERVRPEFAANVKPGDVIVAGPGFGIGSSREQAAQVLVQLCIAAVIAPSYGGLFFRNAFNVGLLLLTCPRAHELLDGMHVTTEIRTAPVVVAPDGDVLACENIPPFLLEMAQAGGLVNVLRARAKPVQSESVAMVSS